MNWKFNDTEPIYIQIADKIKFDIIDGVYKPGDQIPSVRQFADDISVNPNTVQKAMTYLEDEGLVFPLGTTGRFISKKENLSFELKSNMINKYIDTFRLNMKLLGVSNSDTVNLLTERIKEDNKIV